MKTLKILLLLIIIFFPSRLLSQVAINIDGSAPDASAMLDISSTSKGLLVPRMTAVQRTALVGPANGLMVFQTDGTTGLYVFRSPSWTYVPTTSTQWTTVGNNIYYNAGGVAIGNTSVNASSLLDLTSNSKGILIPRMLSSERTAIAGPATGLLVFQTDAPSGFYFFTGSGWSQLNTGTGSSQWTNTGNDIYYSTGSVGVGNSSVDASAALEVSSTSKGVLVPRMTMAQRDLISAPAMGLLIFQTDNTIGFYYYNGSWTAISVPTGISSVAATLPITSSGGQSPNIGIVRASASVSGYLHSSDFSLFNSKWTKQVPGNNLFYTSGYIGIGTPSPSLRFHVADNVDNGYVSYMQNQSSETTANGLLIQAGPLGGSETVKLIGFSDGTNELAYIYFDPNINGLFFGQGSDRRLKDNIMNTRTSIETLMKINVVDYKWKKRPGGPVLTGFIAQDLYNIFPNAVVKPADEAATWMIKPETLIPLLVKSVQDQQQMIRSQEVKIRTLEERLNALEQKIR